jgi:hypothetical protein
LKFTYAAFLLLFIGCTGSEKKEAELNMPGVYKMVSLFVKTDKTDTSYTNADQLKIYTSDFMMYAVVNSPDSVSSFGIGSYLVGKDTVTENVIFRANDTAVSEKPASFNLAIKKTEKGYQQLITGMQNNAGEKMDMTESYESTGLAVTTPLDGTWKLVKRYQIKGKDTTFNKATEYKTYFAGYCMWGTNWKDSASKTHTGIGFGKFTMAGNNKVKESMMVSTFAQVRGHDFDIDIELMGKDGFKQTMVETDGTIAVEVFERLKK